jgi:hypothetical protein
VLRTCPRDTEGIAAYREDLRLAKGKGFARVFTGRMAQFTPLGEA